MIHDNIFDDNEKDDITLLPSLHWGTPLQSDPTRGICGTNCPSLLSQDSRGQYGSPYGKYNTPASSLYNLVLTVIAILGQMTLLAAVETDGLVSIPVVSAPCIPPALVVVISTPLMPIFIVPAISRKVSAFAAFETPFVLVTMISSIPGVSSLVAGITLSGIMPIFSAVVAFVASVVLFEYSLFWIRLKVLLGHSRAKWPTPLQL